MAAGPVRILIGVLAVIGGLWTLGFVILVAGSLLARYTPGLREPGRLREALSEDGTSGEDQ